MRLGLLKYLLVSAFLCGLAWFAIAAIDQYANIFWPGGQIGVAIPAIIATILGTYVGLWAIGRFRKPSIVYGVLVGLLFLVFYFPFLAILAGIESFRFNFDWTRWLLGGGMLSGYLMDRLPMLAISGVIGAVVGAFVIRRVSPSFCPYCGTKLPSGRDPCSNCGKVPTA